MQEIRIEAGRGEDNAWFAALMASTDPWVRLGRDYEQCLAGVSHSEYENWVAWVGGERAGAIRVHPRGVAGSPYIASVVVEAGYRGQGVGGALVEWAERRAAAGRARRIFLCVSSFNPRARALYERMGYELAAVLADYVVDGLDEHLMMKRLV